MSLIQRIRAAFTKTPPPPPEVPTIAELEERLAKVRFHIDNCKIEIDIGSRHTSNLALGSLSRLRVEERALINQITLMQITQSP